MEGERVYTETELEKICMQDMDIWMWDEAQVISDKFKIKDGGALLASMVSKYFVQDSRTHAAYLCTFGDH